MLQVLPHSCFHLVCLCAPSQFFRCFLYMIRCSSEAPPTPVHHTLPSSTGVWFHAPDPPTEEQNTAPGMFTPRDQQGQACSGASCSMCNIDLRGHWFWSIQKKKILLHCFSIYDIFWNKQKNSAIIYFSPVLLLCFMDGSKMWLHGA